MVSNTFEAVSGHPLWLCSTWSGWLSSWRNIRILRGLRKFMLTTGGPVIRVPESSGSAGSAHWIVNTNGTTLFESLQTGESSCRTIRDTLIPEELPSLLFTLLHPESGASNTETKTNGVFNWPVEIPIHFGAWGPERTGPPDS